MHKAQTVADFYQTSLALLPAAIQPEVGHFNVFQLADVAEAETKCSSYGRRLFYKISLLPGRNTYHYADKSVHTEQNALIFSNPQVPYHWDLHESKQAGVFCVFTDHFLSRHTTVALPEYPVFKPGGQAVFQLTEAQYQTATAIFAHMATELAADYVFKYEVLRNATLDLMHLAMRLQPAAALPQPATAASRIAALFLELLERQFPIEAPEQRLRLRFPNHFADQLALHVNHLNKALKEATGQTTSSLLAARLTQEARILLRHTRWSVSEIAWCLGFEELPRFINFFQKQVRMTPTAFRGQ
jgi:AraC-like DNA-binding protein